MYNFKVNSNQCTVYIFMAKILNLKRYEWVIVTFWNNKK